MNLFSRKSKWERLWDTTVEALEQGGDTRLAKVTAGVVGGAVAATVASAAISAVRDRADK